MYIIKKLNQSSCTNIHNIVCDKIIKVKNNLPIILVLILSSVFSSCYMNNQNQRGGGFYGQPQQQLAPIYGSNQNLSQQNMNYNMQNNGNQYNGSQFNGMQQNPNQHNTRSHGKDNSQGIDYNKYIGPKNPYMKNSSASNTNSSGATEGPYSVVYNDTNPYKVIYESPEYLQKQKSLANTYQKDGIYNANNSMSFDENTDGWIHKYKVKENDTLWGISRRYKTSIESLRRNNNISGSYIYPDQVLKVPVKLKKS